VPLTAQCPDLGLVTISGSMQVPSLVFATEAILDDGLMRTRPTDPPFNLFGFGCTRAGLPDCPTSMIGQKRTALAFQAADCAVTTARGCQPTEFLLWNDATSVVDSCAGDSGGPVLLMPKQEDAVGYRLVGLTSRAFSPVGECGPGGIYTKLTTPRVIAWLRDNGVVVTQQ